ncbi:endonuclease VIII [Balneolaceae bacterium YR4-1]|uniref:DNA-(apurinic or apyrimidinic site) lyase n=1 Tax=Halalkalibaculum roseum TaxID=2709311 RepID=A0A6M1T2X7_9BACT|nr:endonuclease VIII [Halalkalibaculum roseum]NGP76355.1 endonuclease VIII [Halalkalibaculum roseum]
MPEGPEIWRAADKLNIALAGEVIDDLFFAFDSLNEFKKELIGLTVEKVEPRGKAILTSFGNNLTMYSHNQLYGKWMIRNRGNVPNNNRQLRVAIHNEKKSAFLYSASDIEMLKDEEVENHQYIQKLGPDVIHPETTPNDILDRYRNEKFINRKLTTLLLDQGFISGIGNYLRSEILFYSGVHPSLKLRDCTDKQVQKLADATLTLSRRSYETKGITNDPEIVEALKREGASRKEFRHFVYNRTGSYCHKCGNEIQEVKTGGRKVYYCPNCQEK